MWSSANDRGNRKTVGTFKSGSNTYSQRRILVEYMTELQKAQNENQN
jgi:hypothetical protein